MGLLTEISKTKIQPPPARDSNPLADPSGEQVGNDGGGGDPEAERCVCIRLRKILLVGNFPSGEFNWSDVATAKQCVGCGKIFSKIFDD